MNMDKNLLVNHKKSWQYATSPLEIPINCVIIRVIFPGGRTKERNLPLLAPVPSGTKNSHSSFDDVVPTFWSPVISRPKTTYTPLVSDTSYCRFLVEFCDISFTGLPSDRLLDDAPNFLGFCGSSHWGLGQICFPFPTSLQTPHLKCLLTKYKI